MRCNRQEPGHVYTSMQKRIAYITLQLFLVAAFVPLLYSACMFVANTYVASIQPASK